MHFAQLANTLLKEMKKVHETITFLLVASPNVYRFKQKISLTVKI